MKRILIFAILLIVLGPAYAQNQKDPDFRYGKLDNGFTYYIRHTDFEPGHADFYLVQNVGALMEEENQNGLAHALEHMAFNGSLNFPEGIPAFLKRKGVPSPNAYTGQDETVYYVRRVPSADAGLVDSCLLILHDWSGFLTLAPEAIEKERKIIQEERRTRRDLQTRLEEQIRPCMYNGSKYASHDVAGTEEVLKNFTRKELQDYYHDFYRPDQQAAIIVGDIDAGKMEEALQRLFAPIPTRQNPKPRIVYGIPDNLEPMYYKMIDREIPGNAMTLMKRIKDELSVTLEEMMKDNLYRMFYNKMLTRQLQAYVQEKQPDFLQASVSLQGLVRGYSSFRIWLKAYPGKERQALRQLLGELEYIHRFGLTEETLKEQTEDYLRGLDEIAKVKHPYRNEVYVQMYQNAFLNHKPMTTVAEDMALSRRILAGMTATDLQQWVNRWYSNDKNWLYIMQGCDSAYQFPTCQEITAIIRETKTAAIAPVSKENRKPEVLMDFEPQAGKIVRTNRLRALNAEKWTLSNGATVYYKYNDQAKKQITLYGICEGGLSQLDAADLPSADALGDLILQSGLYHHDARMMELIMKDREVRMLLKLGAEAQTLTASAEKSELETMFQLVYLQLTQARFDREVFGKYVYAQELDELTRSQTLNDTLDAWMQQIRLVESSRLWKHDSVYYKAMNYDRMLGVWHRLFGDAAAFTFYIAGDVDAGEARRLAERYLASLPALHEQHKAVTYDLRKKGSVKETFEAHIPDDKYMVNIEFRNELHLTPVEEMAFGMLQSVLQDRLFAVLREKEQGTYRVGVNVVPGPKQQFLGIQFDSSVEKGDRMRELVHGQIDELVREGISDEDFNDQVLRMRKNLSKRSIKPTNSFWINEIKEYETTGQLSESNAELARMLNKIHPADLQKIARKFFATAECKDLGVKPK